MIVLTGVRSNPYYLEKLKQIDLTSEITAVSSDGGEGYSSSLTPICHSSQPKMSDRLQHSDCDRMVTSISWNI